MKRLGKTIGSRGYHTVDFRREDKKRTVHAVIAEQMLGPRPLGFHVNHINNNKLDNRPSNLEYMDAVQNSSLGGQIPRTRKKPSRVPLDLPYRKLTPTVWRPVPGFERYEVSDVGGVWDTKRNCLVSQHQTPRGHLKVSVLKPDGKFTSRPVHGIVYLAFKGVIPPEYVIDHRDENKWNNCVSNLDCVTTAENTRRWASKSRRRKKKETVLPHKTLDGSAPSV